MILIHHTDNYKPRVVEMPLEFKSVKKHERNTRKCKQNPLISDTQLVTQCKPPSPQFSDAWLQPKQVQRTEKRV